ncbi:MAG: hypothetical protein OEZ36_13330, partial [Spirochaetota bacterium]|nr:hypothetical protein [Spirochaetota bacterium]
YLIHFCMGSLTVAGWKRFLGILPLVFFGFHFYESWMLGQEGNLLWACHVSGLLLGLGFLLDNKMLTQVSSLWIVIGFPLWIIDLAYTDLWLVSSFFSHIGNFTLCLYGIYLVGARKNAWVYASFYFFICQGLARVFTDPKLNVNVSHRVYVGMDAVFSSYWEQWLVILISVPVVLWIVNRSLSIVSSKISLSD